MAETASSSLQNPKDDNNGKDKAGLVDDEQRKKDIIKCAIFYVFLFLMIILIVVWNFLSPDETNVFVQMFNPTFPQLQETAPTPSSV